MKRNGFLTAFAVSILFIGNLSAQISVTFPVSRAVFQRNNLNNGSIPVHGFVTISVDRMEGRLVPVLAGQGLTTGWQTIDSDFKGTAFNGKLAGTGGWYNIELRGVKNGQPVVFSSVDKVGIGEVFIISGQSNAQGFLRFLPNGATDDRVNAYTNYKDDLLIENPPIAEFAQLKNWQDIGPHGQSAWAWGELGDKIAGRYNVPVLFFNASFEGTTIENWLSSSRGLATKHKGFGFIFPNNGPYTFLKYTLQNHGALYGFRSIIWIQGESDEETSENTYFNSLKEVIEKTRKDTGKDISWMVTRTSLSLNVIHNEVIKAQNRIISTVPNVFAGPNTDLIQNPRVDGVHFSNNGFGTGGISQLAERVFESMDANYLNNSKPQLGYDFYELEPNCNGTELLQLSYPEPNIVSVKWNGGVVSDKIFVTTGFYQAIAKDSFGNFHYSAAINSSDFFPKEVPVVTPIGASTLCVGPGGGILEYTATPSSILSVVWQDGSISPTFKASASAPIFATYQNKFGCKSVKSNVQNPVFLTKPEKPEIASGTGVFATCQGVLLALRLKKEINAFPVWSSGEVGTTQISAGNAGNQNYTVFLTGLNGCNSDISDPVSVKVYNTVNAPNISQSGPYYLKSDETVGISSYEWYLEGQKLSTNTPEIIASQSGTYSLAVYKSYEGGKLTCRSSNSGLFIYQKLDNVSGLIVYPNPVKDGLINITSDAVIENVTVTLIDQLGRRIVSQGLRNLSLPQQLNIGKEHNLGKYYIRLDFKGFTKVFPILLE